MNAQLKEVRHASREQLWLRAVILVATAVFTLAVAAAGDGSWLDPWRTGGPLLLALLVALMPDTLLAAGLLLYLAGIWATGVSDVQTPWSLLAAVCVLVLHTAAALAAAAPVAARLPAGLWRRYLPRMGVALGAAVAVWSVARLATGSPPAGGVLALLAGLSALAAGVLAHARWVRRVA